MDDVSNWEVRSATPITYLIPSSTLFQHPLAQLKEQKKLIHQPNLQDPGYIRQKANAKLWVRERLTVLLDQDSFAEVGSVTGEPIYDEETGALKSFTPA